MNLISQLAPLDSALNLKIFVGQIPRGWDEAKARQFLSQHGQIVEFQMIKKDDPSAKTKGSAFVKFKSMQDGERAILQLKDVPVDQNQALILKWADGEKERLGVSEEHPAKLQVDGLPRECTEKMIREVFEKYGQVTDVQILNYGQPILTAQVSYIFKESCLQAIRNVSGRMLIGDRPLEVRFMGSIASSSSVNRTRGFEQQYGEGMEQEPIDPIQEYMKSYTRWLDNKKKPYYVHWETGEIIRKQVPPVGSIIYSPDGTKEIITKEKYLNDLAAFNSKKTGPPGANLFVFHLPNDHKDSDLMELFSPYGNVISARVMTEPRTGKSKGFGFVSFDKPESAIKAKEAMDGFLIEKKKLSVTFKQNDGSLFPLQYNWMPTVQTIQFDTFDL